MPPTHVKLGTKVVATAAHRFREISYTAKKFEREESARRKGAASNRGHGVQESHRIETGAEESSKKMGGGGGGKGSCIALNRGGRGR